MSGPQVIGLVTALGALIILVELLRRRRLREKYALMWTLLALITLVGAVVPSLLSKLTDLVGVAAPVNLLFFIALLVLFGLSLQFSLEMGRLEEKVRTLAEELAILRLEVEQRNPAVDNEPPVDEV